MKRVVHYSQKLIPFLQEEVGSFCSGKFLRKVLESNLCRVNGKVERFGSTLLSKGDVVELAPSWKELEKKKEDSFLFETLFEDERTKWVNKPSGFICDEKGCLSQFGKGVQLIHRLDKETTGVLGLAKGKEVFEDWVELFSKREVKKSYLALVDKIPKKPKGLIESRLEKKGSFQGQTIWGSGSKGLEAITAYEVIETYKNASLLKVEPITGRTHQIRVHLAELGHPILVDRQYAAKFSSSYFARRVLLHASTIQVGTQFSLFAKTPSDFNEAIQWLKKS